MISSKHNCVFIHIPKTAGQSIERVFLDELGLSWEEREQLLLCQNTDPRMGPPRLAHLTYQEYCQYGYLSSDKLATMFSFAFVRNPWARLVSEYKYRHAKLPFKDFVFKYFPMIENDDYIKGRDEYRHIIPQSEFIVDSTGKVMVDFVGKFERLPQDFAFVSEKVFGKSVDLPHQNKSKIRKRDVIFSLFKQTSEQKHYTELYDEETKEWVSNFYQQDIKFFDYSFEE
ncbi:sulfotransferase family protein [Thalassotalea fusca]